jgi:hypothetical protein
MRGDAVMARDRRERGPGDYGWVVVDEAPMGSRHRRKFDVWKRVAGRGDSGCAAGPSAEFVAPSHALNCSAELSIPWMDFCASRGGGTE